MNSYKVYPKYQENLIENLQVLSEMAIELLFSEVETSAVSKVNTILNLNFVHLKNIF